MNISRVIIASPHKWHDKLVRHMNRDLSVLRITEPSQLTAKNIVDFAPQFIFFLHWSWKIQPDIYEKFNCIVFHMTDLPYGRGGSPLQNLIIRGHKKTQLSAIQCVADVDAGPIYLKKPLSLKGSAEEIFMRASLLMESMINEIITKKLIPKEQKGEVTIFNRRKPEESNISKLSNLNELFDYIRMLDAEGYPSAFLETDHFRLEFNKASLKENCVISNVKIYRKES